MICVKECPDSWDFHNKAPSQHSHPLFFCFLFFQVKTRIINCEPPSPSRWAAGNSRIFCGLCSQSNLKNVLQTRSKVVLKSLWFSPDLELNGAFSGLLHSDGWTG